MKKTIITIIILAIIFVGMFIYRNITLRTNEISVEEIEKIESYMSRIYMWKEVTNEALPCFEDINEADETWIWEAVKKNLEEYELTHEQIQEKAKEIFGEKFNKEFPKEGTELLTYDERNNKYYAEGIALDQQEDLFILNQVNKTQDGYEIEIVEYLEDYSETSIENNEIIIRNINGEEIEKINGEEEAKSKELAKNNIDKLTKKKVVLRLENEQLYIEKVAQE